MKINREFVTTQNTYGGKNSPKYIVIHETDNWSNGAGAQRHASAQAAGHLSTSVHYYSGSDGVYQAANHVDGTYSIGKEYGGNHSITDASNKNTINIEICVNPDGDYNVASSNAVELVKYLIQQTGIPASRVIRHYDAKGKYCPRKMMDNPALWEDFKKQIGQTTGVTPEPEPVKPQEKEQWYRVGTGWSKGICQGQTGAYHNLNYAKAACKTGQRVYDENGTVIYSGSAGQQTAPEPAEQPVESYKVGQVYTLQVELKVRTGAGTQYRAKSHAELTAGGKAGDSDRDGALDKGTRVTCQQIKKVGNNTWMRIPSGWIAAVYGGKIYVK